MTLAALRSDACVGRTLTFAGPSAYTTREVIDMCARMSDSNAQVTSVPTWLLRATRNILKGADWARDASDRLVSHIVVGAGASVIGVCVVPEQELEDQGLWWQVEVLGCLRSGVATPGCSRASRSAGVCLGNAAITSWFCPLLLLALCCLSVCVCVPPHRTPPLPGVC